MTWQELHELSNRIAWYLLDQGIGPGKSVLAALPNIPTHIALAFGIWKTGACYVPVSNRAPQRNLMEICTCVSPALVITNRKKPDGYPGLSTAELKTLCAGYSAQLPPDVLVRDPQTLALQPVGEPGLLQVLSALPQSYPGHSLLTEDLGVLLGEDDCPCGRPGRYFTVLGRQRGAEVRGCSDTFQ